MDVGCGWMGGCVCGCKCVWVRGEASVNMGVDAVGWVDVSEGVCG